ncbi:DNA polymerase III subunit beta [Prevotella sp. OH937_COT-195]|uniref:DNA polymerase III subunit beta n=1 Tax=Prevotella sp. OH937_COT-195 TaxID=2491051 RepID=UPI000F64B222|nr:DNA polymerase III subunit beta [Prevotella sp. OH937_COT-195]RRC99077.1 DNA polymerase III subunit beta [Prevotella sp. OH937_COT-195]
MIFHIDRNILLAALQRISYGVATAKKANNTVRGNSVYQCFVFDADYDQLTIKATDLEVFMSEAVSIGNPNAEKKAFAVEARPFLRAIKTLESQNLQVEVLEYQIIVTHSIGSFAFPLDGNVTIFDTLKEPMIGHATAYTLKFEAPGLRSILNRCDFAVADDQFRPVMNGVCFRFTKEFTDFVALDGHRLARIRKRPILECESPVDMVMPRQVVSILQAITPKTGFIEMAFNEYIPQDPNSKEEVPAAVCAIYMDGVRIVFRPINGKYPNYQSVIPTRFSFDFSVNRQALIKSFERLIHFANNSSMLVTVTLTPGFMGMAVEDVDFETKADEKIPCQYDGGKFRIGFKIPSLLSILKNLTAPDVTFSIVDALRAVIIAPKPQPDSEELTMLIMPMLLKD